MSGARLMLANSAKVAIILADRVLVLASNTQFARGTLARFIVETSRSTCVATLNLMVISALVVPDTAVCARVAAPILILSLCT